MTTRLAFILCFLVSSLQASDVSYYPFYQSIKENIKWEYQLIQNNPKDTPYLHGINRLKELIDYGVQHPEIALQKDRLPTFEELAYSLMYARLLTQTTIDRKDIVAFGFLGIIAKEKHGLDAHPNDFIAMCAVLDDYLELKQQLLSKLVTRKQLSEQRASLLLKEERNSVYCLCEITKDYVAPQ